MVRPYVLELDGGVPWGGNDLDRLRIAALARTIQTRLYMHTCSPRYCLKDRSSCRFQYISMYISMFSCELVVGFDLHYVFKEPL